MSPLQVSRGTRSRKESSRSLPHQPVRPSALGRRIGTPGALADFQRSRLALAAESAKKIGRCWVMGGKERTLHSPKCGSGIQHSSARRCGIRPASQWAYAWRTPIERVPALCRLGRGPEARYHFVICFSGLRLRFFHSQR